ncbi:MAG: hypothetical protein ABEJ44_01965 [Halanaeroarchaeum sp.]
MSPESPQTDAEAVSSPTDTRLAGLVVQALVATFGLLWLLFGVQEYWHFLTDGGVSPGPVLLRVTGVLTVGTFCLLWVARR